MPENLTPLPEIVDLLRGALARSPADETEIVWTEGILATTSNRPRRPAVPARLHRTVAVRVLERGRLGSYRTVAVSAGELDDAIRQALAQGRIRPPLPGVFHLPAPQPAHRPIGGLHDPAVATLDEAEAVELCRSVVDRGELARLTWGEGRFVVANSLGVAAATEVTVAEMVVSCGRGAGAGRAERAVRALEALDAPTIVAEARSVHTGGLASALPGARPPRLLLSTQVAAALVAELNRAAFTASAYREPGSVVAEHRGRRRLLDPKLTLRDDATSPAGLPFPFDLEGTPKRPVDLVVEGAPITPALDHRQAAAVGLAPTGHAVSGDDARAENLFVLPASATLDDLLREGEGGLWLGWLETVAVIDPLATRFRATVSGVRRIAGGALAEAVPDLVWEDSLLRVFSGIEAIGRRLGIAGASLVGCVASPRLLVTAGGELKPATS